MSLKGSWKHGERPQMWLNKLKIAIIEKNTKALGALLEEIPSFEDKKDIEQAAYLLREAASMVESMRNETAASMKQIKKNLDFLSSTGTTASKKLDIRS